MISEPGGGEPNGRASHHTARSSPRRVLFIMGLIWFRSFGRPYTGPQRDEGSIPSGSTITRQRITMLQRIRLKELVSATLSGSLPISLTEAVWPRRSSRPEHVDKRLDFLQPVAIIKA